MSTTPISATILAHLFIDKEKINLVKILGIILGFLGIVYLFSENLLINDENLFSALMILVGSTFYVIGGILTLKISHKKNENVTASILIWGTIFVCPISLIIEQPWNLNPSLESTLSLIYLGVFPTGIAWLLRFMILKRNGLVFQSQVAYLIPIFGVILGYLFLNELVTSKILISLFIVILGIYFVKKSGDKKIEGI
jgi:drug/metabolite transporter (DMT)-like permease